MEDKAWVQLPPANSPGYRADQAAAYDPETVSFLTFGGQSGTSFLLAYGFFISHMVISKMLVLFTTTC